MRKSVSRKALPRESSGEAGERASKGNWRPLAAGISSLPFQALRASFPEGKPAPLSSETEGMKM